ncbi:MAG: hypothetical protein RMJ48_08590 [Roseiflexaceae bacterium]|nr:hypothetical protein [Roseiflexaceae bacterium]
MKTTNPQSLDQDVDQPRNTFRHTTRRSSSRPSQPRFVLQPVVLDDPAPSDTDDRRLEAAASGEKTGHEAVGTEPYRCASTSRLDAAPDPGSQHGSQESTDQARMMPLDRHASSPGRPTILGALFVCGVIAIALFVTLLLAGSAA